MSKSAALRSACLVCFILWVISFSFFEIIALHVWSINPPGTVFVDDIYVGTVCFLLADVLFILSFQDKRWLLILAGLCLAWVCGFVPLICLYSFAALLPGFSMYYWCQVPEFWYMVAMVFGVFCVLLWLGLQQREQGRREHVGWYAFGWVAGLGYLFIYCRLAGVDPLIFGCIAAFFGGWLWGAWLVDKFTHISLEGLVPKDSALLSACLVSFGLWVISAFAGIYLFTKIVAPSFTVLTAFFCFCALCLILSEIFFILLQRERRSLLVLAGICFSWFWIVTSFGLAFSAHLPRIYDFSNAPFIVNSYGIIFTLGSIFTLIWLGLRVWQQWRQSREVPAFWYTLGLFLGVVALLAYFNFDFGAFNFLPVVSLVLFVSLFIAWRLGWSGDLGRSTVWFRAIWDKLIEGNSSGGSVVSPDNEQGGGENEGEEFHKEIVLEQETENDKSSDGEVTMNALYDTGTVLGESGKGREVTVDDVLRQSGCYVLGVQGVGKSSMLEQMIYQDIRKGQSVIVLDPHGDLVDHALAQMPEKRLQDVALLSLEDTAYPFGLNLFSMNNGANEIEQSQALDRVLHVFEKCFPETSRMLLEKYLGNIAPVFFAHADVGYGMTDIPTFLLDDTFREGLIKKSRLFVRRFWENDYGTMSPSVRRSETGSLATRLNRFLRSPIVGNIIGQSKTTIDFRKAIENKEIIFIRLPIKTLKDDATLIGTMLVAQIHAAIFSFADMNLEDRPGFSFYVDEFQHFCSSDFAEMFTEGRKFGARVTVAHQFRGQLPDYLASATMTARTKITFQTTQEDAPELAPVYVDQKGKGTIAVDPKPLDKLATYASDNPQCPEIEVFINFYLRPVRSRSKGGKIEYMTNSKKLVFDDPSPQLNDLLYRVQKRRDCTLEIPEGLIYGFCGCGETFLRAWEGTPRDEREGCLSADVLFPQEIIERVRRGIVRDSGDEFWRFLWCLRRTMLCLSQKPIGEEKRLTAGEVVQQIINLPRRHALAKIGNDVQELKTLKIPESVSDLVFKQRRQTVVAQTRNKYCRPATEVEEEIIQRLGETMPKAAPGEQPGAEEPQTGQQQNDQPPPPLYEEE
jgi:hypothetical protein